jgi:hypothetical protein
MNERELVDAIAEHTNGEIVESEHFWTIYPRDCETCGGVGAARRIAELEAARDQQAETIKRLRERMPKGDPNRA